QADNSILHQVDAAGRCIRDAQLARAAIPPLRRLSDLIEAMQAHCQLSSRLLCGDAREEPRRAQLAKLIDEIQDRTRPPVVNWQRSVTDWRLLRQAVASR